MKNSNGECQYNLARESIPGLRSRVIIGFIYSVMLFKYFAILFSWRIIVSRETGFAGSLLIIV